MLESSFPSLSEENGLLELSEDDLNIYCIGISTGGEAELKMAKASSLRRIVATTIDPQGKVYAEEKIARYGLSDRIKVKLEDIKDPLPYPEGLFDFVYARLVLHYLSKQHLASSLKEILRVLKQGGKFFVVVRSDECLEARHPEARMDPKTGMTTYPASGALYSRCFYSEETIQKALEDAGFVLGKCKTYPERLCIDFERKRPSLQEDLLIEIVAAKP